MTGALAKCRRCPRLAQHLDHMAELHPDHHCAPVGRWGAKRPRLLIVGLAPGASGANRTGRAFVGDSSGKTLFAALANTGWATSVHPHDARLPRAAITNVVKCLPPENRPTAAEIRECGIWLAPELEAHLKRSRRPSAVLCLGGVATDAVRRMLGLPRRPFEHGWIEPLAGSHYLASAYHPSRQNVNTGRLKPGMLEAVLNELRERLGP